MSTDDLLAFMRRYRLGVQASIGNDSAPQAAVVGIAITDRFEIVFDTLVSTRKLQNLRRNPRVAFVIGGVTDGEARTVQYEGIADEPSGDELDTLKAIYYAVYPDGPSRLAWHAHAAHADADHDRRDRVPDRLADRDGQQRAVPRHGLRDCR